MKATWQPLPARAFLFRLQPDHIARPDWYVGAMVATIDGAGLATAMGLVVEEAWRGHIRIIDRAVDATLAEIGATDVRFVRRIAGRCGYYHRMVRAPRPGQGQDGVCASGAGDVA